MSAPFYSRSYQRNFMGAFARREFDRFYQVWHRQAGKDDCDYNTVSQQIVLMDQANDIGDYVYLFPEREQARKAFWDKICGHKIRLIEHIPEAARAGKDWINEAQLKLWLANGTSLQVGGARFPDAWRGPSYRGAILSECARMNPGIVEVVEPQVIAAKGWMIYNTTPWPGWAKDLWLRIQKEPSWWKELLTVDHTRRDARGEDGHPVFGAHELEMARLRGATDEWLQQEYWCSWQGIVTGSILGRLMESARRNGRIGRVPWEPTLPVHTWWDLGTTAVVFTQHTGREILVIDYLYKGSTTFQQVVPLLFQGDRAHYLYGSHNFPFDMQVTDYTAEDGRSRIETAQKLLGEPLCHVGGNGRIRDRINAGEIVVPRSRFDEVKCGGLISALEAWHFPHNEGRSAPGAPYFDDKPVKDWASHGSDAYCEMAMHVKDELLTMATGETDTASGSGRGKSWTSV